MNEHEIERRRERQRILEQSIAEALRLLRRPAVIGGALLFIGLWAMDIGLARARGERALMETFDGVRAGRHDGRTQLSDAEAEEAWRLVAASSSATVLESSSHTSGFLLPFVSTSVTLCLTSGVSSSTGTQRLATVVAVDSLFGIRTVRWKALSVRRPCTCATGDDETCKLVDGSTAALTSDATP